MKLRSNKEFANFISFLAMYKSTDLSLGTQGTPSKLNWTALVHNVNILLLIIGARHKSKKEEKQILGDLSTAVLWCKTVKEKVRLKFKTFASIS